MISVEDEKVISDNVSTIAHSGLHEGSKTRRVNEVIAVDDRGPLSLCKSKRFIARGGRASIAIASQ
jgi:hypothetical protein